MATNALTRSNKNKALKLLRQDQLQVAATLLEKVCAKDRSDAEAWHLLCAINGKLGKLERAEYCCRQASMLNPNDGPCLYNLGKACNAVGKFGDAIDSYKQAIACTPPYTDAYMNLARLELLCGDFEHGWQHYVHRQSLNTPGAIHPPSQIPDDVSGKRIYIRHDQGIGDELFFLRFAKILKDRGAWLAYYPGEKIRTLVSRLTFLDEVIIDNSVPVAIDLAISVGDLPLLTGMKDITEIPPSITLEPHEENIPGVRSALSAFGPPPYTGITWRAGSSDHVTSLYKQLPRQILAEILRDVTGTIVVLQRNPLPGEISGIETSLGKKILDMSALNDDLEKMLALISLLDRQIAVSNTNIHLATALGKTADVLIPFPPEWRWMADGNESPWFPGSRLYRQSADGSWAFAIDELHGDLIKITS